MDDVRKERSRTRLVVANVSVHVLAAFMDHSQAQLATRLVGIVMADAAGSDGICWLDQTTICRRARCSEATVRRAVRELETLGDIQTRTAQRGRRRINVYRIVWAQPPDYDRLPFDLDRPFDDDRSNRAPVISTATTGHPDRDDRSSGPNTPSIGTKENVRERTPTWRVNRHVVTVHEQELSQQVLAAWNTLTGQVLTNRDWRSMIVSRLREHPELELADHERVMKAVLAEPWWQGAPSPNVIYGSGAQFERSLTAARTTKAAATSMESERSRFAKILGGGRA